MPKVRVLASFVSKIDSLVIHFDITRSDLCSPLLILCVCFCAYSHHIDLTFYIYWFLVTAVVAMYHLPASLTLFLSIRFCTGIQCYYNGSITLLIIWTTPLHLLILDSIIKGQLSIFHSSFPYPTWYFLLLVVPSSYTLSEHRVVVLKTLLFVRSSISMLLSQTKS